ncbi:MAG TPA: HAD family phosphatase [Anaerolineaceae bacterium]|nr:HAD family phosphatase [Anaerolineaceae bacterium]HPN51671.1 HAD family phosphatase [Anaerolineaceae bacterium]
MIKAIIFDFGGVLVKDSRPGSRGVLAQRLKITREDLLDQVFGNELAFPATIGRVSEKDMWQHVFSMMQIPSYDQPDFVRDFWGEDELDAKMANLMKSKRPNFRIGILSNAWSDAREAFVSKYHLDILTDEIIISAEEGLAKPDLRIYRLAANRLNIRPDEAIFMDDVLANVLAAQKVGFKAFQHLNAETSINKIESILSADQL